MTVTENQLFEECAKGRRKQTDVKTYAEVWSAMCKWIFYQFERGKGASLGNVLKLTWIVEETGGVKVMRPKLVMTEGYAKAHNLQITKYRPGIDPEPLHAEEINFAKIAIRFSSVLQKDTVFTATRDMFHRMGALLSSRDCKFDLAIGFLVSRDHKVDFVFDSKFHKRAYVEPAVVGRPGTNDKGAPLSELSLNRNEQPVPQTPSVCATDEKYTFVDDEDALSEHVRQHFNDTASQHSDGSHVFKKSSPLKEKVRQQELLAESAVKLAYERHLRELKKSDVEDQRNFKITNERNEVKDAEMARRADARRKANMELKEFLEEQIREKERMRDYEKIMKLRSTENIPWTATVFPAEPDHGPIQARKLRERENLRHVLAQQVNANQRKKEIERERQLEEDRIMMDRINREMQESYISELETKADRKARLMEDWKRQAKVKELERLAKVDPTNPALENPTLETPADSPRQSARSRTHGSITGRSLQRSRMASRQSQQGMLALQPQNLQLNV